MALCSMEVIFQMLRLYFCRLQVQNLLKAGMSHYCSSGTLGASSLVGILWERERASKRDKGREEGRGKTGKETERGENTAFSGKKWYFFNWFIYSMPMRKWGFTWIRSGLGGYLQCSEESFVSSCVTLGTAWASQGRWLPLVTLMFIASLDFLIYPVKVLIHGSEEGVNEKLND